MDIISIQETKKTPGITLNVSEKLFEIKGRSMPEDATEFYEPIISWLRKYSENPIEGGIPLVVKLDYFNTTSSKMILEIFKIVEGIGNHTIMWHYFEDDEDMQDAGEDFQYIIGAAIEMIEIN